MAEDGDLAEDQETFVCCEGDFVVAVESAAVVDPAVGVFDDPAARLGPEPVGGFGAGHDIDADTGALGALSDRGAGVALVEPDVGDGGCDRFRLAKQYGGRLPGFAHWLG